MSLALQVLFLIACLFTVFQVLLMFCDCWLRRETEVLHVLHHDYSLCSEKLASRKVLNKTVKVLLE